MLQDAYSVPVSPGSDFGIQCLANSECNFELEQFCDKVPSHAWQKQREMGKGLHLWDGPLGLNLEGVDLELREIAQLWGALDIGLQRRHPGVQKPPSKVVVAYRLEQ